MILFWRSPNFFGSFRDRTYSKEKTYIMLKTPFPIYLCSSKNRKNISNLYCFLLWADTRHKVKYKHFSSKKPVYFLLQNAPNFPQFSSIASAFVRARFCDVLLICCCQSSLFRRAAIGARLYAPFTPSSVHPIDTSLSFIRRRLAQFLCRAWSYLWKYGAFTLCSLLNHRMLEYFYGKSCILCKFPAFC